MIEAEETVELSTFLKERYRGTMDFEAAFKAYQELPNFKVNQNVSEVSDNFDEDVHQVAKLATQFYLKKTFEAMKIDLSDSNTEEDISTGNIGTPGRVAKMWMGSNLHDDRELLSGRWATMPRLARFPNTHKDDHFPITKRIDLTAVCSHHLAPFSTSFREDAYAIISYIPNEWVLGISKLQRVADNISQRGWLQEELTQELYNEVKSASGTDSVYVRLVNVVHTCESLRGAKSKDGSFTTEYFGGEFTNRDVREQIK